MTTLEGHTVAVSVSDSPDRARLGYPEREVRRALLSICTVLVRQGAKVGYAGNLAPDGITFQMFRHLAGAYAASRETPFIHIVPEPVLRRTAFDELLFAMREGANVATTRLHVGGALLLARHVEDGVRIGEGANRIRVTNGSEFAQWLGSVPPAEPVAALTSARLAMARLADATIVLGGRMGIVGLANDAYEGALPGVVEEAMLTLEADKPCVPLGAFGGAARDVAIALGLLDASKAVPRGTQLPSYQSGIARVANLRDRMPVPLVPQLSALADDDRSEPMAYAVSKALTDWFALTKRTAKPTATSH